MQQILQMLSTTSIISKEIPTGLKPANISSRSIGDSNCPGYGDCDCPSDCDCQTDCACGGYE